MIIFLHRTALKASQYTYVFLDSPKDVWKQSDALYMTRCHDKWITLQHVRKDEFDEMSETRTENIERIQSRCWKINEHFVWGGHKCEQAHMEDVLANTCERDQATWRPVRVIKMAAPKGN